MKLNGRVKRFFYSFTGLLLALGITAINSPAEQLPSWLAHHQDYIKNSRDSEWAKWIKELSTPEAIRLGKEWGELMGHGYAPDVVAKSKIAPDIKPGVVITQDNYQEFAGYKELMPASRYLRIKKGSYLQYPEIKIVPTVHYYWTKDKTEATRKNLGKTKVGPDGELVDWIAGMPFPGFKSAREMAHNLDRAAAGTSDQLSLEPVEFYLYGRDTKIERYMKMNLYWRYYTGRTKVPPMPQVPGTTFMDKGSIVALYPFDIKGTAFVRTRKISPADEDGFICYLPPLRRVRRMAGSDTQDPLLGSDVSWEDWRGWWQKLSNKIWPLDFKILGEKEILCPIRYSQRFRMVEEEKMHKFYFKGWERRPCFILQQNINTSRYLYSKRIFYADKEDFSMNYVEYYDQRGKLWRTMCLPYYWTSQGDILWYGPIIVDWINRHASICMFNLKLNDPKVSEDQFNLRFLTKVAR